MVKGKSQHIEGIYKFISNYEKKYNIKFGAWEGLSLGNIDPHAKRHKLVWCERKATTNVNHIRRYAARGITPFDGVPYIFLGETFRRCAYGVYRYIKHFHNKRQHLRASSRRFCTRSSLYCGCPGIIVIREVMKFHELKIDSNTPRLRFNSGRQFANRWARKDIEGQRWFFFFISPLREHENHTVPVPGGCSAEPFTEDKLVVLNEEGEVIGFEVHDPDNPSADPSVLSNKTTPTHIEHVFVKRARLEASVSTKTLLAAPSSLSHLPDSLPSAPTVEPVASLSYEDSLLNHEQPTPSTSASAAPISPPFRPIQPRPAGHSLPPATTAPPAPHAPPASSAPAVSTLPLSMSVNGSVGPRMGTPTKVVRIRMEPRRLPVNQVNAAPRPPTLFPVTLLNANSVNSQLKAELTQFQKETNNRLNTVESRLSSMEARLSGLESVVLDMSSQLRALHSLLEAAQQPPVPAPPPPAPAMPPDLAFACAADDVVPLEPFSPASLSDEEGK